MRLGSLPGVKQTWVGVDIGTYAIKVAEIRAGNPPMVTALGQVRLPVGSVVGGRYKDVAVITERLKTLLENLRIRNRRAVVSISSYGAIIKRLELTPQEEQELSELVYEEAEAHIPYDMEEVYLDYQVVGEEKGRLDVLVVATKKDVVDTVAEIVEEAGLLPAVVDIDAIALGNVVECLFRKSRDERFMVVDFGASKTSIVVWEGGAIVSNRDVSSGLLSINEHLQSRLKLSFEESELLKVHGVAEKNEACYEAVLEHVNEVLERIKDSLSYHESEGPRIEEIYLSGGGGHINGIEGFFSSFLERKVRVLKGLHHLNIKKVEINSAHYYAPQMNVAIGLGIREIWSA